MDAFCVYHDEHQSCYLGSLKAATALPDIEGIYGEKVNCVVSMCGGPEMHTGGAPDWSNYMTALGVHHHFQLHIDDRVARSAEDFHAFGHSCLRAWSGVYERVHAAQKQLEASGERLVVLFHCLGGVNRGPGALLAWLIACGATTEEAFGMLLTHRKGLRPMLRRSYALAGLCQWEDMKYHIYASRLGATDSMYRIPERLCRVGKWYPVWVDALFPL